MEYKEIRKELYQETLYNSIKAGRKEFRFCGKKTLAYIYYLQTGNMPKRNSKRKEILADVVMNYALSKTDRQMNRYKRIMEKENKERKEK